LLELLGAHPIFHVSRIRVTLIMSVPNKTANQHFTVFKIIALPNRIRKDEFVLYQFAFPYFVNGSRQRDYALLTEKELQQCSTSTVRVCSISTTFYDANCYMYIGSIFSDCRRK